MLIREMSRDECLRVLAGAKLARLGCTHENQPYVVPVCLAYDESSGCLYGFTSPGQKVEWMRANPRVCIEVDEIVAHDQWVSVIAIGRYEELLNPQGGDDARLWAPKRPRNVAEVMPPGFPECRHRRCDDQRYDDERYHRERERARQVLETHAMWWDTACAIHAHRDSAEPFVSVFYRIRIDRVTGYDASRDAGSGFSHAVPATPAGRWSWLSRALSHVFGGESK